MAAPTPPAVARRHAAPTLKSTRGPTDTPTMRTTVVAVAILILAGCTVRHASPLAQRPDRLCIQRNPAVTVPDFLPTLQEVLLARGVKTTVYDGNAAPADCPYVLTYTARRGWDM